MRTIQSPLARSGARRLAGTLAALGLAVAALSGCGTQPRPSRLVDGPAWYSALSEDTAEFSASIQALLQRHTDRPVEVLILSAGGANGVWGAGLLRGWCERPKGRPPFDLVAGISAGALLGTHTLLGTQADHDVIEKACTGLGEDDIFEDRFIVFVPFSSSLATSEPLSRFIARLIPDATIDRVAEEGRKGRLLLVGTVSLDRGRLQIWNLTELAMSSRPDRYDRYRLILLASSSFPILVPGVMIDGEMHADGALRSRLFAQRLLEPIAYEKGSPIPIGRVYVVVNGKAGLDAEWVSEKILDMGQRALKIVLDDNLVGAIDTARRLAKVNRFRLHWCRIPEQESVASDPKAFETKDMLALFESARALGRTDPSSGSWDRIEPKD